jgi:hypothetical protein
MLPRTLVANGTKRHFSQIICCGAQQPMTTYSPNGSLWNFRRSLRFDTRGLDHLGPLLGVVGNELRGFSR